MKKVDIVYPYWINSHTGASKNLIRFKNNIDFFRENEIELSFFTMDSITPKDFTHSARKKRTLRSIVGKHVNTFSKYNAFISWQLIKRSFKGSNLILEKYYLENSQPDVIDFQDLFTCFYYLQSIKKSKAKIILFNHTNGEDFKMWKLYYPKLENSMYYNKLIEIQKYVLDKIDKYVFISDLARKRFLEIHNDFPASKTQFFHNGVPKLNGIELTKMEQLITNRDYSKYNFVCTGTLNSRKGQELIIKALSQIELIKRERIMITFLGEGAELEKFKRLANSLHVDKYIDFVGGVDNVDDYLAKANIFILASKDEGLPISIIEAMRAHLPIIGTAIAGIPEMINDGVNGVLIIPSVEFVIKIFETLDKYDWKEMGIKSYQTFLSKFTLDKMMVNYCKLINEL
jgi:glycosyltransferase involved in cell wall biosynthesis